MNDNDREKPKAVSEEESDAKARAEARVREIKRKKELAKQAKESGETSDDQAEEKQEISDAKAHDETRVRELKEKKELAKETTDTQDVKAAAEARVREIKRKKEEAKKRAEATSGTTNGKLSAEERVREIKRKKEAAQQAKFSDAGSKLSAEERVKEIKRKKEAAKQAGTGTAAETDGKLTAQERVKEIKRKKEAAKKATGSETGAPKAGQSEREKKIAAMKAKARAKAAKAKAGKQKATKEEDVVPSPNQPLLDKYVKVIGEHLGEDALEDSYINRLAKDVPTLVARPDRYFKIAEFLRRNEQLAFDYLSDIHGIDYETHMEVYVHLYSFQNRQPVALKVKLDRDSPEIDSVTPLWKGADWPEREAYDLLGIRFKGHPNLQRILMPDDWVGHPLRKDYEPYDVEV